MKDKTAAPTMPPMPPTRAPVLVPGVSLEEAEEAVELGFMALLVGDAEERGRERTSDVCEVEAEAGVVIEGTSLGVCRARSTIYLLRH